MFIRTDKDNRLVLFHELDVLAISLFPQESLCLLHQKLTELDFLLVARHHMAKQEIALLLAPQMATILVMEHLLQKMLLC